MAYYAFIESNKINGVGQAKIKNSEIRNIEITEEIFKNIEQYKWNGNEIIINDNYEKLKEAEKRNEIAHLNLTKREVFLGLYKAKQVTPEQIRTKITDTEALIEFDYADKYYRGNPLIDLIGKELGITPQQLDNFFITKDYKELI